MTAGALLTGAVWAAGAGGFVLFFTKPPARRALWLDGILVRCLASVRRLRLPVGVALLAAAISRWPAVGLLAGLVAWSLPVLVADTKKTREARLVKREAVAKWLEMLADGFAAGGFLQTTLLSTERTAPPAIKAEVERLCRRLRGHESTEGPWEFDTALAAFADEFGDRDVDRAVVALVCAAHGQARDLSQVIRKAASLMRERVAVDRRIESGPRAFIYLEVRFTEALMAVVGIVILLRLPVLRPLGSPGGQLYLIIVGGIALLLLRSLAKMARPPESKRVLVLAEEGGR